MIENVKALNKDGNYANALIALEEVNNKDRYYYYEAAKTALGLKNYDVTIDNINKVLAMKADWVGACGIKVAALNHLRKFDGIAPALIDLINNSAKATNRESSFASIFNELLDYKVPGILIMLDAVLEYYRFKLGADDFYNFYKGIVNSNTGQLRLASSNFNSVTNLESFGRHSTGAASFNFGENLDEILNRNEARQLTPIKFSKKKIPASTYDTVMLASCDNGYFETFIELLISSISSKLERKVFHIHVINPSKRTLAKCSEIARKYHFFNFSHEVNPAAQKLEFACSRFIRLEEFLHVYKKDVVVCDMDSCFIQDFDVDVLLRDRDIAVKVDNKCKLHFYPWRQFIASFVVFKYNPTTLRFTKDLSKFLTYFVDRKDRDYWYVDQTALFCLLEQHAERHNLGYRLIERTSHIVLVPNAKSESKKEFVERMLETV